MCHFVLANQAQGGILMKYFQSTVAAFVSLCLMISGGLSLAKPAPDTSVLPPSSPTLYFLNTPETVKQEGVLANFHILGKEPSRIFFHFRNFTGSAQTFRLAISGSALNKARWGFIKSLHPGVAGSRAAEKFMTMTVKNDPIGISLSARVRHGETISGIVEGVPINKAGATVKVQMGRSESNVHGSLIQKYNNYDTTKIKSIAEGEKIAFRLGELSPGGVDGEYGSTLRFVLVNTSIKQKVKLSLSPRAGAIMFVYSINGVVTCTKIIPTYRDTAIVTLYLKPNEKVTIETFIAGGWCYPCELRIKTKPIL